VLCLALVVRFIYERRVLLFMTCKISSPFSGSHRTLVFMVMIQRILQRLRRLNWILTV
jgi:hypothetical protein